MTLERCPLLSRLSFRSSPLPSPQLLPLVEFSLTAAPSSLLLLFLFLESSYSSITYLGRYLLPYLAPGPTLVKVGRYLRRRGTNTRMVFFPLDPSGPITLVPRNSPSARQTTDTIQDSIWCWGFPSVLASHSIRGRCSLRLRQRSFIDWSTRLLFHSYTSSFLFSQSLSDPLGSQPNFPEPVFTTRGHTKAKTRGENGRTERQGNLSRAI